MCSKNHILLSNFYSLRKTKHDCPICLSYFHYLFYDFRILDRFFISKKGALKFLALDILTERAVRKFEFSQTF